MQPLVKRFPAPALMGVVNVTPDSFSDGGRYLRSEDAVAHGLELAAEGAHLLDVGGESTRPGALPVPVEEELERVLPVVAGLRRRTRLPLSIDTMKAAVAERALAAGASFVNDVSALRHDEGMAALVAETGADVCLVHMRGEPRTMQDDPRYDDVVEEVCAFLAARADHARRAGVPAERICVDPGIGFGKTLEHNLELLRELPRIASLGYPVLVGLSRKRSLAALTGSTGELRDATVAANALALARGAWMFRVHDVAANREGLAVAAALVPAAAAVATP